MEGIQKLEKIGGGGTSARAYKARDIDKGTIVFLKKIRLDVEHAEQSGLPQHLLREISIHKSLNHPNVVTLYKVVKYEKKIAMVFEFVDQSLCDILSQHRSSGGLPIGLIKSYTFQMLAGIAFCHSQRVLHRDLNPQNILVDRTGTLKLSSLTLASIVRLTSTLTHEVVATWYRCPEILLGAKQYSTAIDIWSIGCIIAELASDEPLFPGAGPEIVQLILIFQLLGTPTEETWTGVTQLRDYNPMFPRWHAKGLGEQLPRLDGEGVALLARTLTYDPARRISAGEAMDMPYLHEADDR
jgi:serine/threonine protein kinase